MKKLVRTSLVNTPNRRGIKDLNIQFYSHDKNNAGFEFVIKNETDLSEYTAKVLYHFVFSDSRWESAGTIEGNVVKANFNTDLIARCEEVLGYLFLDSESNSLDVFKFKFNVVLSEIDKNEVEKRKIKHVADIETLELVTRSELRDELAKLQVTGGVDLSGYLTTTVAEDIYVKKTDLPAPYNDSALVERVTNLENKTDRDTVYDDTSVKERLTTLENKPPVDLSNYATKQELANVSGSQPIVDTSNLVTRQELEGKHYATEQLLNNYALKSEIPTPYNDSELVQKIGQLEARVDKDTVYDDTSLKERVTALESKAIEGGAYDDTHLRERLDTLEAKQDKDTVYNDEEVKRRLTELENRPAVDTSHFITDETLESKGFLTAHQDISNLATKEELDKRVTKEELEEKHYVTNEQISSTYATKSEIPQPYSDTELVKRITVLENRQDNDTVYDDAELKRRVTALEEKPSVDTSNFVTTAVLESKGYLTTHQDISNLVTKQELHEATEIDYSNIVTTEELEPYAKKSELPAPYNDSALVSRVSALESKQDKDTVYDDTKVKERLTALESKPAIDTSNLVTKSELNTLRPLPTLSINNDTLSISGGNSVKLPTNQWEIHGTGIPNGVVEAEIGTTYVDKNKTNGALKWIKTTNGGNQGWEVLIGDTGWRTLNSVSKAGNSFIKIRRVNNLVTYQFGGLQWGWFGVGRRNGPGFVRHNSSGDKGAKVIYPNGIPEGFRSENSLVGPTYDDKGRPYGIWYLGGKSDLNFIQFTFNDPIPTDRDIGDIRVSAISYLTADPWPLQLP
ncbi:hypothetical protein PNO24_09765 [Gemella haemolysans]|uniref:hypothetical protein n=1 Tax=Gemella haemolysans TaxID=1379 RepID=UPI00232C06C6|nr:hypothetical protein [Gemella haemolysans]MDB6214199.1 hypothetical protein [Gemella haemolysans]